jgi:esterase/lipase superfamily enzyme
MPELLPLLPGLAAALLAAGLHGVVWRAARGLDRLPRGLARAAPLAVIAGLLLLAPALTARRTATLAGAAGPAQAAALPAQSMPPSPHARESTGLPKATLNGDVAAVTGGSGSSPGTGDWDVVPVLYGTDRARQGRPEGEAGKETGRAPYGAERARRLELGRALVTVPAAHRIPSIERPFAMRVPYLQLVLYEQGEDPKRHFTIKELQALPRADFLALARERVKAGRAFKDQALVFVHGFNTAFDQALYRTAQLAYDLQFDGGAFLYSWPSAGGVAGYVRDRESATQAEPYLEEFLTLVVEKTGARNVSVIAHSMGNLPLLNVLRDLGPSLPAGVRLNEIILAAPDVDRDVFANLVGAIAGYGRGVTLYCSANDRAMTAARSFAGGVPRAGDVPPDGPVILPGVDTIDVTETGTDLLALNHSLYAERSALLNDIGLLLQTGERPPERRIPILQRMHTARGDFWRYP